MRWEWEPFTPWRRTTKKVCSVQIFGLFFIFIFSVFGFLDFMLYEERNVYLLYILSNVVIFTLNNQHIIIGVDTAKCFVFYLAAESKIDRGWFWSKRKHKPTKMSNKSIKSKEKNCISIKIGIDIRTGLKFETKSTHVARMFMHLYRIVLLKFVVFCNRKQRTKCLFFSQIFFFGKNK